MMEPLPWFAFKIHKYLAETMHLDTKGHGAYLLLILHYYATGTPPKDNDRSLAAITKLTADCWAESRGDLGALFTIRDGFWRHYGIEADMREASSKHAASVAKAKAGADARWAKSDLKNGSQTKRRMPRVSSKQARSNEEAPTAIPETLLASSEQSSENAHLHKHTTTPFGSSSTSEPRTTTTKKRIANSGEELPIVTPAQTLAGTALPKDWVPGQGDEAVARGYGMDPTAIEAELVEFHRYNAARGTILVDWSATWSRWCKAWKARQRPMPRPRSDTNATPWRPSHDDWHKQIERWKGNQSRWSHKTFGPEPGMGGCRCPATVLMAHGINPKTGLKLAPNPHSANGGDDGVRGTPTVASLLATVPETSTRGGPSEKVGSTP